MRNLKKTNVQTENGLVVAGRWGKVAQKIQASNYKTSHGDIMYSTAPVTALYYIFESG